MPLKISQLSFIDPVIQFQSELITKGKQEKKLAPRLVARGIGIVALPIFELIEAVNLTLHVPVYTINGAFKGLSRVLPNSQKELKEAFENTPGFTEAVYTGYKALACYFGIIVAPCVSLVNPEVCVRHHRLMGLASSTQNSAQNPGITQKMQNASPFRNTRGMPPLNLQIVKTPEEGKIGFERIIGQDVLKAELKSKVINPYKAMQNTNSSWIEKIANEACAISPQQSLILYGPTGCGKTSIAQALAEEMGVNFIPIAISDLGSTYQHGTITNLKEAMEQAAKNAPCVLFFDEFDALVRDRATMVGNIADAHEVVNEFLIQLEKIQKNGSVFVIAATNHLEKIDPAIIRSGRFDMKIEIPKPDLETRKKVFFEMMKDRQFEGGDLSESVAQKTEGWNVADFVNLHQRINLRLQPIIVQAIKALNIGDSPSEKEIKQAREHAQSIKVPEAVLNEEVAAVEAQRRK